MSQKTIEEMLEETKFLDLIKKQKKQTKLVLYSIATLAERSAKTLTGESYDNYSKLCKALSLKQLTKRRFSGIISNLESLQILNTKVISKGRYGKTREITLNKSLTGVITQLKTDLNL